MAVSDFDTLGANYVGRFFLTGANSRNTPFVTMLGGLAGGRTLRTKSKKFAVSVISDLDAGAQPSITEDTSQTAPTAVTTTQAQVFNTVQIYHEQRAITYWRNSDTKSIEGLAIIGGMAIDDPRERQIQFGLAQMNQDYDVSCLSGAYASDTSGAVAAKSRGMANTISTCTVAAGANQFSKAYLNTLLEEMWDAGAPMSNLVAFVGSGHVKSKISDVYGYAPESRTVGGVSISQIITDYDANVGVVLCPNLDASLVYVIDMDVCFPVLMPVATENGTTDILVEDLSKVGAKAAVQLYAQLGLAPGPEHYHGSLTGLATS